MQIISRVEAKERGLSKFFTGETCKRGHVSERYTKKNYCVACHKEWLANNPDRVKQHEQKRVRDPLKMRVYNARWAAKNVESIKERGRKRYRENRDRL